MDGTVGSRVRTICAHEETRHTLSHIHHMDTGKTDATRIGMRKEAVCVRVDEDSQVEGRTAMRSECGTLSVS